MKPLCILAGAGLMFMQTSTLANTTTGEQQKPKFEYDEVVVTARRIEESVQDVPITITTVGEDEFLEKGLFSFNDVGDITPGLSIDGESGGTNFVSIRGVGNLGTASPLAPATSLFIDQAPAIDTAFLVNSAVDIALIEILRGPQGTLYGTNATAGAINVYTKDPALDSEYNGYIEGTYSAYDINGNDTYDIEGAIDIPITEDVLGLRLSGSTRTDKGFINNAFTNNSVQKAETDNVRAKILWQPNEVLETRLTLAYNEVTAQQPFGIDINAETDRGTTQAPLTPIFESLSFDDFKTSQSAPATNEDQFLSVLNVNWQTEHGDLTSITSYQDRSVGINRDFDRTSRFEDEILFQLQSDQISQETRFSGTSKNEKIDYLFGIFYSSQHSDTDQIIDLVDSATLPIKIDDSIGQTKIESAAIFTNNTFHFTDTFSLSAGLRLDHSSTNNFDSFVDISSSIVQNITNPSADLVTGIINEKSTESNWAASLKANYYINDNTLIYGTLDRAFRRGGFNSSTNNTFIAEGLATFDTETSNAFEIGFKSDGLFDNRLRLNGSFYYQTFKDYQYQQFDTTAFYDITSAVTSSVDPFGIFGLPVDNAIFLSLDSGLIMNAPEVVNQGLELEALFQLNDNWSFTGALSTNNLEFKEFNNVPGSVNSTNSTIVSDPAVSNVGGITGLYAGSNTQALFDRLALLGLPSNTVTGSIVNVDSLVRQDLSGANAGFYPEAIPLSVTTSAEYKSNQLGLLGGSEWFARAVYTYNKVSEITAPTLAEDFAELDIFIGLNDSNRQWTAQLFVTNVLFDHAVIAPKNIVIDADNSNGPVGLPNAPREIGLTFRRSF